MEDPGQINQKILDKLQGPDALRKLESAYRDYPTTFYSPEVKRLYLRFYDITTVNVHYVEVIARLKEGLGAEVAEEFDNQLTELIRNLLEDADKGLDRFHALMQTNGLTKEADFLGEPMTFAVRVTSPIMRNYLRLMEKIDQLIRMMETLRIDGVLTTAQCDTQRNLLKRQIKRFAGAARGIASKLRARAAKFEKMHAERPPTPLTDDKKEALSVATAPEPVEQTNGATATTETIEAAGKVRARRKANGSKPQTSTATA